MMVACISGLILVLFGAKSVSGCYKKEHIFVNDTRELVPADHPSRMLGWEQMVLMFGDQVSIIAVYHYFFLGKILLERNQFFKMTDFYIFDRMVGQMFRGKMSMLPRKLGG